MSVSTSAAVSVAVQLSGSLLPCGVCGVSVSGPHLKRDVRELTISAVDDARLGVRELHPPRALAVTRCEACRGRLERAQAAVAAFPVLPARIGSPSLVVERLEAVLAVEGVTGTAVRLGSAADCFAALEHLGAVGAASLWSARFVPVQAAGARLGVASAAPFAHVDAELLQGARDALAALLRARMLRTAPAAVPLGPPADSARRGCLMCGVATSTVWEAAIASARALGASASPGWLDPIEGDVCGRCADVLAEVGAVGQTALRRALLGHLGAAHTFATDAVEMRVLAWGALPAGTCPNREPWGHLDLAALRRDMRDVAEKGYVDQSAVGIS